MSRSKEPVQADLFTSMPAPPVSAPIHLHHAELVSLLSRLLWEVVQVRAALATKEIVHE